MKTLKQFKKYVNAVVYIGQKNLRFRDMEHRYNQFPADLPVDADLVVRAVDDYKKSEDA